MSNTEDTNNKEEKNIIERWIDEIWNLPLGAKIIGIALIIFVIYIPFLPDDHWLKELISDLIKVEEEDID